MSLSVLDAFEEYVNSCDLIMFDGYVGYSEYQFVSPKIVRVTPHEISDLYPSKYVWLRSDAIGCGYYIGNEQLIDNLSEEELSKFKEKLKKFQGYSKMNHPF